MKFRLNDLLLVLRNGACIFEDGGAMDASHDHRTSLENFSIDTSRFADVVDHVLLDHGFGLALVHWDKSSRRQLRVPRSHYVFCFD